MRLDEITGWIDKHRTMQAVIDYYKANWENPDSYVESPTKDREGYPFQFSKKWNFEGGWQLEYFKDIRGTLVALRQNDVDKVGWVFNHALGGKDDKIVELTLDEVQQILGVT